MELTMYGISDRSLLTRQRGGVAFPAGLPRRLRHILASQSGHRQNSRGHGGAGSRGAGAARGRGGGRLLDARGAPPLRRAPRKELDDDRDDEGNESDDDDDEEDGFLDEGRPRRLGSSTPRRPPALSGGGRGGDVARGAGTERRGPLAPAPAMAARQRQWAEVEEAPEEEEPRGPQDPFDAMHERLMARVKEGATVRRESWEKLFGHMRSPRQARAALALMLADARAREAAGWDWATHGYGQTAFQLVQAAAQAGAPEVAESLLAEREALHLTLNKDLVPSLMRKVAAAVDPDGADADEQIEVVQRLYDTEVELRGSNSPEAAYELSRVLRRAGDVGGVRSLHGQVVREGLAVREGLLQDMQRWLAKRGVRV